MTELRPTSKSFFDWFFCCGDKEQVSQPTQPFHKLKTKFAYDFEDYLQSNPQKDPRQYGFFNEKGLYMDRSRKIKTRHNLRELWISDTARHDFPYSCPICFRYFNCTCLSNQVILKSDCCKNYICHICAIEFHSQQCHFCASSECTYTDPGEASTIRKYSSEEIEFI